ncbi:hypothetical protein [Microvirga sp. M2]|uniref:hypothetical protein n=1 Tax=Microvirga sp. M2 TaxID=3073270 RepID=UPI0039C1CCC6
MDLKLTVDEYLAETGAFDPDDLVIIQDDPLNIYALDAAWFAQMSADNVDFLDSWTDILFLTAAQIGALGAVRLHPSDAAILYDSADSLEHLTPEDITSFAGKGIDFIDCSDDAWSMNAAQAVALARSAIVFMPDDVTIVGDTSDNIASLSAAELAMLAEKGLDGLGSIDGDLVLNAAQADILSGASVALLSTGAVVLADAGARIAALTAAQMTALADQGVSLIDARDGFFDLLTLDAAQAAALAETSIGFSADDTVVVSDRGANIASLSATQLATLLERGLSVIDATDGQLVLDAAQAATLAGASVALTASTMVVADRGAHIAALSADQLADLAEKGLGALDALDDLLILDAAQAMIVADSPITLTQHDETILSDTGANIAAMSLRQLAALVDKRLDTIDATDNVLVLDAARAAVLADSPIGLTAGDNVKLSDTGENISALTPAQIFSLGFKGLDRIDVTDNRLVLNADQAAFLAETSVDFAAGDTVVVADTGQNIAALTPGQIAILGVMGVDTLVATDNRIDLSALQFAALGSLGLRAEDQISVSDTGAAFADLTVAQIADLTTKGVDTLDAIDNQVVLSAALLLALGTLNFSAGDRVRLVDTGRNIERLTPAQIQALVDKGIDSLDVNDDPLSLSVAQFNALEPIRLVTTGLMTLTGTGASIAALTPAQIGALIAKGLDAIDATSDLTLTAAQFAALGTLTLSDDDVVAVSDTGANIAALTARQIAALIAKGVDTLDATDDQVALSVAQLANLGTLNLSAGDRVTVTDAGENISALTLAQVAALIAKGVDTLDAIDEQVTLSVAQLSALGALSISASDTVAVVDTGANFATLSADRIAGLIAKGIDVLDAVDDRIVLSSAQLSALGSLSFSAGDMVTLRDNGATLAALTPAQIGALIAKGVDTFDAIDNRITLSSAQVSALGSLHLGSNDIVSISGTAGSNTITGTSVSDAMFGLGGNDTLGGSAGNDTLNGGTGKDVLTGGAGRDTFVFNTALNSRTNVDRITDFRPVDDTIKLENGVFRGLTRTGTLSKAAFHVGAAAHDGDDRIIYNKTTGALLYDADGNGKGAALQFATLSKGLAVTNLDFVVI